MAKKEKELTLLVLSGGLDSFVLAHKLASEQRHYRGLYINFGKPVSRKEVAAVKQLSLGLHLPIDVINLEGMTDMQLGYVPDKFINRDEADIKDFEARAKANESYVSGFQVLLGIASYHAQITGGSSMALGVIKSQFEKHSKLRDVFSSFESVVGSLNPHIVRLSIETPLSVMTKAEVVKLGFELGVGLENSWSCLFGRERQCGECSQCLSRKAAFKSAKIKDSTVYEK